MAGKELPSSGEPRTIHNNLRQEQKEDQPLPRVWNVLERMAMLHAPEVIRPTRSWAKMVSDLTEQEALLRDKGSDYDKAVLDLFTAITSSRVGIGRPFTLKQFTQFRTDFEELSEDEFIEAKHQLLQDVQELRQDAFELQFPQES
jgi:hypothetical protein